MNPTLKSIVGDYHILWFNKSNKYLVVNSEISELIEDYIKHLESNENSEKSDFANKAVFDDLQSLLEDCSSPETKQEFHPIKFYDANRNSTSYYKIANLIFEINYCSDTIRTLIHPQISYLEIHSIKKEVDVVFDIFIKNSNIYFFKDKRFVSNHLKKEFYLFQGKFAIELLSSLHNNYEKDWLATFHASTIAKNDEAIMLIGNSGSGKSTFTSLAMANGFDLIADDFSPMLRNDKKMYLYPGAISIKSGAFNTLSKIFSNFESLDEHYINPYKGYVKYIPPRNKYSNKGYHCNKIILINYEQNSESKLEKIKFDEALQILIPESWLEPSEKSALTFMNWIKTVTFYKLTYSDNNEAIDLFSNLYDNNKTNN